MKTYELFGAALDWAVAKSDPFFHDLQMSAEFGVYWMDEDGVEIVYSPSTDWAQGGPIIEREKIRLEPRGAFVWTAHDSYEWAESKGHTPLVAAMRCYVASRIGDEVEVPEELLQGEHA